MHHRISLACCLALVISGFSFADEYTLQAATDAAAKMMPAGETRFALYNLPTPQGKPKDLLELLRISKGGKVNVAVTSPKIEYIRDTLAAVMKMAKNEKFEGANLIIVGDRVDEKMFEPLFKGRGIAAKYTTYEVPIAKTQNYKRVSFDEFFAGQIAPLHLSLEIPSQYAHAVGLKAPFSYSYWMQSEEVAGAAKSQNLPDKTGYIYGKLSPNESFDQASGKFMGEAQLEAQLAQAGLELIERKRFQAKGYPVFAYIVRAKNGTVVCSMFVATLIESNVLYLGYRPPNNDLATARAVWSHILASLQ